MLLCGLSLLKSFCERCGLKAIMASSSEVWVDGSSNLFFNFSNGVSLDSSSMLSSWLRKSGVTGVGQSMLFGLVRLGNLLLDSICNASALSTRHFSTLQTLSRSLSSLSNGGDLFMSGDEKSYSSKKC